MFIFFQYLKTNSKLPLIEENAEVTGLGSGCSGASSEVVSSGSTLRQMNSPKRHANAQQRPLSKYESIHAQAEMEQAVESAKGAFRSWSKTSAMARQQIMFRYQQLIKSNIGELAKLITLEQGKTLAIPASPVLISGSGTVDKTCTLGAIAISLNGVSIYGGAVDSACTQLDVTSTQSEWTSFDMCAGHAASGDYHYHFPPSCLLAQADADAPLDGGHSPQIGWAQDGFPICPWPVSTPTPSTRLPRRHRASPSARGGPGGRRSRGRRPRSGQATKFRREGHIVI